MCVSFLTRPRLTIGRAPRKRKTEPGRGSRSNEVRTGPTRRPPRWLFALAFSALSSSLLAHDVITSRFDFANDIRPILERHCGRCHETGGLGPFDATSYGEVRPRAVAIAAAILERTMPPYFADLVELAPRLAREASDGLDTREVSAREIDQIIEWARGGAPEVTRGRDSTLPDENEGSAAPATPDPREASPHALSPDAPAGTLAVEVPEVRLGVDMRREIRDHHIRSPAEKKWLAEGWSLETSHPELVLGATLYRGDAPSPTSFLGAWSPAHTVAERGSKLGARFEIPPAAPLLLRVVYHRPWTLGREQPVVSARLLLDPARPTTHRWIVPRALTSEIIEASEDELLALFPLAPLRLDARHRNDAPAYALDIFRVDEHWPLAYTLGGVGDELSFRIRSERPGVVAIGLFASPRAP